MRDFYRRVLQLSQGSMQDVLMTWKSYFALLVCILLGTTLFPPMIFADRALSVASVFGDNMVLQRGISVPVWGTSEPGSAVVVSFAGQKRKTKTNKEGRWRVVLGKMKASAKLRKMVVASESLELPFDDVLVGEVWLCSGQSNMKFRLANCSDAQSVINEANHPNLRLNRGKGWTAASPESVPEFSGVAYFFGRKLHADTNIPVGLIARALGGTPVEWWTPKSKLSRVEYAKNAMMNPSKEWIQYEKSVASWKSKIELGGRKKAGKKPQWSGSAEEGVLASIYAPGKLGSLYTQHFEAMAGYGIRGALWYQGERNSKAGVNASKAYRELLANMITSWREEWGQGDFPFLAVQLPRFSGGGEGWALVQEAQAAAVSDVPNAAYIDIRDQPDDGLHPKNKKPVGERLAKLAYSLKSN